jgi:hypothetical protein
MSGRYEVTWWEATAGGTVGACRDCGCVVFDPEAHDRWHEQSAVTGVPVVGGEDKQQ